MSSENKFLLGFGGITLVIILIGAFFLGRQPNPQEAENNQTQQIIDQSELVSGASHTKGNTDAPVTIVEFSDLQCSACKAAHPIIQKVLETYHENVYFIYRHYPLSIHKNAKIAGQASEAAGKQGKFFEMTDKLFINQSEWEKSGKPKELFEKYASEIGLDIHKFNEEIDNLNEPVESDYALGNKFNVQSTPTFFINGEKYPGVVQFAQFEQIIKNSIAEEEASTHSDDATQNDASTSEEPDQPPAANQ